MNGRRTFLRNGITTMAALPLLINCKSSNAVAQTANLTLLETIKKNAKSRGTEGMGAIDAPVKVGPKVDLADASHGGDLIKISGTVYQPDGKTPAANTLIYLYHTDREGYYGRTKDDPAHGKYRGWMLTNERGSYAFVTIKPAPYPQRKFAAHIHMTVTTEKAREDWVDSILFEGDGLISTNERETAGQRGGFQPIVSLKKGDGGLYYATRDIRLMA